MGEVIDATREVPLVFVKSLLSWIEFGQPAQMPFSKHSGGISRRPHRLGNGKLLRCQAPIAADEGGDTCTILVTPGHERTTSRRTVWPIAVEISKFETVRGQLVYVWCLNRAAVNRNITVAEIVGQDDDEVGLGWLWRIGGVERGQRREQQGGEEGGNVFNVFHDVTFS